MKFKIGDSVFRDLFVRSFLTASNKNMIDKSFCQVACANDKLFSDDKVLSKYIEDSGLRAFGSCELFIHRQSDGKALGGDTVPFLHVKEDQERIMNLVENQFGRDLAELDKEENKEILSLAREIATLQSKLLTLQNKQSPKRKNLLENWEYFLQKMS